MQTSDKKSKADKDFPMNSSDSDDIIVRHDSDEEENNAEGSGESPATLAFWSNLPYISKFFEEAEISDGVHRTFAKTDEERFTPFGQERLLGVELVSCILALPKDDIFEPLNSLNILK